MTGTSNVRVLDHPCMKFAHLSWNSKPGLNSLWVYPIFLTKVPKVKDSTTYLGLFISSTCKNER